MTTRQRPAENFFVVDTDAHYITEFDDISEYLPQDDPWRLRLKESAARERDAKSNTKVFPKFSGKVGTVGMDPEPEPFQVTEGASPMVTKEDVIEAMDKINIDACLLLSNQMLVFGMMELRDRRQSVFANAYVDYMLDNLVDTQEGMYLSIPVPYQDTDESVELIDRVGDEEGVIGVCFVVGGSPPMGDRKYDPIYEAAQDHGLPIMYHSGSSLGDNFYVSGFSNYLETHSLGFVWDNMATVASIISRGTPVKFPDLEFIFQESGLFWVPQMMYRLDMEYMRRESYAPMLEKRPSEYMQEFYYCTQPLEIVPTQRYYEYVFEMIGGADRIMYASDYPHPDYDDPAAITDLTFLSREDKAKILGENAREVFGL